jgi:hypothetical protein
MWGKIGKPQFILFVHCVDRADCFPLMFSTTLFSIEFVATSAQQTETVVYAYRKLTTFPVMAYSYCARDGFSSQPGVYKAECNETSERCMENHSALHEPAVLR